MNKAALLIGVSEYNSESGLKPLPSAAEDVQAMQRVLLQSSEFSTEDITVLTNPQKHDVEEAIYKLFSARQKEDLLLFYFSGHGIKDETGRLYFSLPTTCKEQNGSLIKYTAIPTTDLHESMNDSRSTCQVVVLDCCFSAAFAKGLTIKDDGRIDIPAQLGGKGRVIFTSSDSIGYSFCKDSLKLSVYTHFFVQGLEEGTADLDEDGLISADEMDIYVSEKVRQCVPEMNPQFFPAERGHKIYLARSTKDHSQLKCRKAIEQQVNQSSFQVVQNQRSTSARKDTQEADYAELETSLANGNWEEADRKTSYIILKSICKGDGNLLSEDLKKIPRHVLCKIDKLWTKHSGERFGFSVQKRIWQEGGGKVNAQTENYLSIRVGWVVNGKWLTNFTYSIDAPEGHLPLIVSRRYGNTVLLARRDLTPKIRTDNKEV